MDDERVVGERSKHVILIGSPRSFQDKFKKAMLMSEMCGRCGGERHCDDDEDIEEPEVSHLRNEPLLPSSSSALFGHRSTNFMGAAVEDESIRFMSSLILPTLRRRNSWPPADTVVLDRYKIPILITKNGSTPTHVHDDSLYPNDENKEISTHQRDTQRRLEDLAYLVGPSSLAPAQIMLKLLQDSLRLRSTTLFSDSKSDFSGPDSEHKTNKNKDDEHDYNNNGGIPVRRPGSSNRSMNRSLSASEWEIRFNSEVGLLYDELNEMRNILSNMLYTNSNSYVEFNLGSNGHLSGTSSDLGMTSPLLFPASPIMSAEEVLANIIAFIPTRETPPAPPSSRRPSASDYPIGELYHGECEICIDTKCFSLRPCCSFRACDSCLKHYLESRLELGSVAIECINSACRSYIHRNEILSTLPAHFRAQYMALLQAKNISPTTKTCPRCNHLLSMTPDYVRRLQAHSHLAWDLVRANNGDEISPKIKCSECSLWWCFLCHSPWHSNVSCKQFKKGDRLLKKWAKELSHGQVNAQKCPKCKIYIQRTSGCDHMQCSQCKTDFCYKCGEKLRRMKFFGDHYSKYSIFGCKYRYKADKPVQRKVIRGAVFGSKVMLVPVLGSMAVCAGFALITVGIAGLPLYAGLKIYQKMQERKYLKAYRSGHGNASNSSGMTSPIPQLDGAFVESNSFTLATPYNPGHQQAANNIIHSIMALEMNESATGSGFEHLASTSSRALPRPVSNFADNIHAIQAAIQAAKPSTSYEY